MLKIALLITIVLVALYYFTFKIVLPLFKKEEEPKAAFGDLDTLIQNADEVAESKKELKSKLTEVKQQIQKTQSKLN